MSRAQLERHHLQVAQEYVCHAGTWYDASGKRRRATQYHEVMGYWGGPFLKYAAQTLVAVHLVGTCTAQIIACSGLSLPADRCCSCERGAQPCMLDPPVCHQEA